LTPGIWTTDRSGAAGYNGGQLTEGDGPGHFTNSFGGTSSACPGAAGVVALVLAVNPELKWHEVKALIKGACDKIDPQGGAYDSVGHSHFYGHGRLNAATAVALAQPAAQSGITVSRQFDAAIPDLQTVRFEIDVSDNSPVNAVSVELNLRHTFIGDLIVTLEPPAATGVGAVTLHQREGGSAKDLVRQYDSATTAALGNFAGKRCKGKWTLQITDAAAQDSGTLVSFTLRLSFAHQDRVAVAPASKDVIRRAVRRRRARAMRS
jgi:subtilisin-like proprotein convertase family protein